MVESHVNWITVALQMEDCLSWRISAGPVEVSEICIGATFPQNWAYYRREKDSFVWHGKIPFSTSHLGKKSVYRWDLLEHMFAAPNTVTQA